MTNFSIKEEEEEFTILNAFSEFQRIKELFEEFELKYGVLRVTQNLTADSLNSGKV